MTNHLNRSIQNMTDHLNLFKWSVMYLYTTVQVISNVFVYYVQVISHVFVYYSSSDQSCICILRFKKTVLYLHTAVQVISHVLYTTVQMISHVFVYYGSSDQSCICILWFKWSVMNLYTTVQVISHTNTWLITWTIVYKYVTDHLNCSIQIHDWSLEP
jgi:hypothetical protein